MIFKLWAMYMYVIYIYIYSSEDHNIRCVSRQRSFFPSYYTCTVWMIRCIYVWFSSDILFHPYKYTYTFVHIHTHTHTQYSVSVRHTNTKENHTCEISSTIRISTFWSRRHSIYLHTTTFSCEGSKRQHLPTIHIQSQIRKHICSFPWVFIHQHQQKSPPGCCEPAFRSVYGAYIHSVCLCVCIFRTRITTLYIPAHY